jgi:methyl-accepting chemotaxis protein
MKREKEQTARSASAKRGWGITGKLALSIVTSVIVAVAVLLVVVYMQMSQTLLEKSEDLL